MMQPLRILLLADAPKNTASTIHDHLRMFRRHSRHDIRFFNPRGLARSRFLDLDAFDVVILHYSLVVSWDTYLAPAFREQIRCFGGLKVQFLQDEYRWVDEITTTMRDLGVDVLYSVVPPALFGELYGDRLPDTDVLPTLTGYVPDRLVGLTTRAPADRPIDVGYRGRALPYWVGRLGFEKIEVGRGFLAAVAGHGLRTDIAWSEQARIYGSRWDEFLGSCRTMLASESGSSIIDYDGSVERAVRAYLSERPSAPYEEVEKEVLRRLPPTPQINALSPRLFEAAAQRTGMVMFPGEYSDAVEPWEHYIPLEKDFANVDEVVERIRDSSFLQELTGRAYEELIGSGRYSERQFVERFDADINERARRRPAHAPHRQRLLRVERSLTFCGRRASRLRHAVRSRLRRALRSATLRYLGFRHILGIAPLRRLLMDVARGVPADDATSGWEDVLRLAILTSIQRGRPVCVGEPFHVVGSWDEQQGRLTLTSRPGKGSGSRDQAALAALEEAARTSRLVEILWSHAELGQLIPLRIGPGIRTVKFIAGGYDAYGVYRFDTLVTLARERPEDVVAALAPFVTVPPVGGRDPDLEAKRGARQ